MKILSFIILSMLVQNCFPQKLELTFYCSDVLIISEYTNDTIARCRLFIDREETLNMLGDEYTFEVREEMFGSEDTYVYEKDAFSFYQDSTNLYTSFDIFSHKFKLLIKDDLLIQVGDNVDICFEKFKPIPIEENKSNYSSVIIYYLNQEKDVLNVEASFFLNIIFDKKSRRITQIKDVRMQ